MSQRKMETPAVAETKVENKVVELTAAEPKKKNLFRRAYDGICTTVIKVKSTRGGRAVIRISKGAAIAAGLYGSFKLGQKSVTPTKVIITEGVDEEREEEEIPTADEVPETEVKEEE